MSRVLVIGASARAAAASLDRAGYEPVTVDLYADADCQEIATCHRADSRSYPASLAEIAARLPAMDWLYTGGLENHPEMVEQISTRHKLLGNGPTVLKQVRDRAWLAKTVSQVPQVAMPDTLASDQPTPQIGKWLSKPPNRSGGLGIRVSQPGELGGHREKFIDGQAIGITYITSGNVTSLWGITEQFCEAEWHHVPAYHYAGGVIPTKMRPQTRDRLLYLGQHISQAANLKGAWNLDCVVTEDCIFVLELNPRVTASIDLFDVSSDSSLAQAHIASCSGQTVNPPTYQGRSVAKMVYYAPCDMKFASLEIQHLGCIVADRPTPGTVFCEGEPVVTLLAIENTRHECMSRLQQAILTLDQHFTRTRDAA